MCFPRHPLDLTVIERYPHALLSNESCVIDHDGRELLIFLTAFEDWVCPFKAQFKNDGSFADRPVSSSIQEEQWLPG